MATTPILARFQIKRDTTANWRSSDIRLQQGEPGWDYEAKILKIGNGNDAWKDLLSVCYGGDSLFTRLAIGINSTTPFVDDTTLNFTSDWLDGTPVITNGILMINDITDVTNVRTLYIDNNVTFADPINRDFSVTLNYPNYFIYGHTYQVIAKQNISVELSKFNVIYNNIPESEFLIVGDPYVISNTSIGIDYSYLLNPRLEKVRIVVFTNDINNPVVELDNQIILRNLDLTPKTNSFILTKSGGYIPSATYYVKIFFTDTIESDIRQTTFVLPTIQSYIFDPNDNRIINVQVNNTSQHTLTVSYTLNGNTITQTASSTNGSSYVSLNEYPVFNTVYNLNVTFEDGSYLTESLTYNTIASIANININKLSVFPGPSNFTPSLTFRGIGSSTSSARLKVTNTDNSSEYQIFILDSATLNANGDYWFGDELTYTPGFLYGNIYTFDVINTDFMPLASQTVTITGSFTIGKSITDSTPSINGTTVTIANGSLEWTGINYNDLQANIYVYVPGQQYSLYTNSQGTLDYDTTTNGITIALNVGVSFISNTQYVIIFTLPNQTGLISSPTTPYANANISTGQKSKTHVLTAVKWIENKIELTIWNSNSTGSRTTKANTTREYLMSSYSGDSIGSLRTIDLYLESGVAFVYKNYYVAEVKYTTTSNSYYYSSAFRYMFDSFTISNTSPQFSGDRSLTVGLSCNGINDEDRFYLSIYRVISITPALIGSPQSISVLSVNSFAPHASQQLTFTNGNINNITFANTFTAGQYYFVDIATPDSNGHVIATSVNAFRYDPASITNFTAPISAINTVGQYPTNLVLGGSITNCNYTIDLFHPGLTPTRLNSTDSTNIVIPSGSFTANVGYTFPIIKSTSANSSNGYYVQATLNRPGLGSVISRYPLVTASPNYFNYTYDYSIYSSQPVTVEFSNNQNTAKFYIPWKGNFTQAFPYLADSSGNVLKNFDPITLSYRATTGTITTGELSVLSTAPTPGSSSLLPNTSYYPGVFLTSRGSTETLPLGTLNTYAPFRWTSIVVGTTTPTSVVLTFINNGAIGVYDPDDYNFTFTIALGSAAAIYTNSTFRYTGRNSITSTYTLPVGASFVQNSTYTASITQLAGQANLTNSITYNTTRLDPTNLQFEDYTPASPALYQLGRFRGSGTLKISEDDNVSIIFKLYEYTTSGPADTTTKTILETITLNDKNNNDSIEYIITQDKFTIEKYYSVSYTIQKGTTTLRSETFLKPTNIQYAPTAGYDILVFIGQSNMVGRDTGGYFPTASNNISGQYFEQGTHYENYNTATNLVDTKRYPLYSDAELNVAIKDKQNNNVKIINRTTGELLDATAANFISDGRDTPAGSHAVSQAYEFTKLYANSNLLATNRDVGVVFVPTGNSGFTSTCTQNGGSRIWNADSGGYNDAVDDTNKYARQRLATGNNYSVNRVVVIVMHQGEADTLATDWASTVKTSISAFVTNKSSDSIPGTSSLSSIKYTRFLTGNLALQSHISLIDSSQNINNSRFGMNVFGVSSEIDIFSKGGGFQIESASFSSLGLVCVDPDSIESAPVNSPERTTGLNPTPSTFHLSARDQRILGFRAFNAYLRLLGKINTGTPPPFPSLLVDSSVCRPPNNISFDTTTKKLLYSSSAINSSYSANPVAYLITLSQNNIVSSSVPFTNIYTYVTEYNGHAHTSSTNTLILTNTKCRIPYYTHSNGDSKLICSYNYGSNASLNIYMDPTATATTAITGSIYPAVYSFPPAGTPAYNLNTNGATLAAKSLTFDMTNIINSITPTTYLGLDNYRNRSIYLNIKGIYNDGTLTKDGNGNLSARRFYLTNSQYYLPPIIGNKLLSTQNYINNSSLGYCKIFNPNSNDYWNISPSDYGVNGGSPILITNQLTGPYASGSFMILAGNTSNVNTANPDSQYYEEWVGRTPGGSVTTINISSATPAIITGPPATLTVTILETPSAFGLIVGNTVGILWGVGASSAEGPGYVTGGDYVVTNINGRRITVSVPYPNSIGNFTPQTNDNVGTVSWVYSGIMNFHVLQPGSTATMVAGTGDTTLSFTLVSELATNILPGAYINLIFGVGKLHDGSTDQIDLNGYYKINTITNIRRTINVILNTAYSIGNFTAQTGGASYIETNVPLSGIKKPFLDGPSSNIIPFNLVVGTPTKSSGDTFVPQIFPSGYLSSWNFDQTTGGATGMVYTIIETGLDWAMFFSAGQHVTTALSNYPGRTTRTSSTYNCLQCCGVVPEKSGTEALCRLNSAGRTLSSILGVPNAMYYFMYSTGNGFILKMRNINANATYEVSYYIGTREGRVPHNDTTVTTVTNAGTDYYLTNPFPIRIYTKAPNDINSPLPQLVDPQINIGQDIHFGIGTDLVRITTTGVASAKQYMTTTHIHNGATEWDGSWKQLKFVFSFKDLKNAGVADAIGTYGSNQAYIRFGALPITRRVTSGAVQPEYVNLSINIGGISIKNIS